LKRVLATAAAAALVNCSRSGSGYEPPPLRQADPVGSSTAPRPPGPGYGVVDPMPPPAGASTHAVVVHEGKLSIESDPVGARLEVDGRYHGNKWSVLTVPVGAHHIKLTWPDGAAKEFDVQVVEGQTTHEIWSVKGKRQP
jgi:hypothetical protein